MTSAGEANVGSSRGDGVVDGARSDLYRAKDRLRDAIVLTEPSSFHRLCLVMALTATRSALDLVESMLASERP